MVYSFNAQFGQKLVDRGMITSSQLHTALDQSKESVPLSELLFRLGYVQDAYEVLDLAAKEFGIPVIRLKDIDITPEIIALIPSPIASHYKIVPVKIAEKVLVVASIDPMDTQMLDVLGMIYNGNVQAVFSSEKEILEAIRRYYGVGAETIERMMGSNIARNEDIQSVDNLAHLDDEASIGKFINQILLEAYKDRATDIHIEPSEQRLQIRYRIDGILRDAQVPANIWHFRDSIASRIKILSNLNIAEKRLAQDGRFKVKINHLELDLRVSFLPTQYGESIAIRLLSSSKLYSLTDLGMNDKDLATLKNLISRTHGIIFVTGPTGSGKTTTLYSCLAQLDRHARKVITIEDPIEYRLEQTTQVQVHPAIGLTFASGLRSMLRHDPDVMMVGEVRDLETAQIAVQIALTGHLVFSTLHTNDAASAVTRLLDMGVEPYLITSSVECFIAQRLVRLLCPRCKYSVSVNPQTIKEFGLSMKDVQEITVFEAKGCSQCNETGYYGRQGVFEFLSVDEKIRALIMAHAPASHIREAAIESGMQTMLQDGWRKIVSGITSPSEVLRVVREEG